MNIFAFVIGLVVIVLTMVVAFLLVIINESKKPQNKVHFYVNKTDNHTYLTLGKYNSSQILACENHLHQYGLNPNDFQLLNDGQRIEVFLNLED